MKRAMILLLTLVTLSACGGGGGSGGNSAGPQPTPRPERPPTGSVNWGDLACQRNASCENPVLNESWADLQELIRTQFVQPMSGPDADFNLFACGKRSEQAWLGAFGEAKNLSNSGWEEIGRFLRAALNKDCTAKADLDDVMNAYFKQTKEYQGGVE